MAIVKGAQSTLGNQDANNTTGSISGAIDSTGAGVILGFASFEGVPDAGGSVSADSKGNTGYVELGRVNHANNDMTTVVYAKFAPGSVGAGHTATYTPGSARPFKYWGIKAVAGTFPNATCLDALLQASGHGTAYDAGTLNTNASALIAQWNVNYAGDNQSTPAGSWISGDEDLEVPGRQIISKVQVGSVTGFDPTTTGVVAVDWNAIVVALKEVTLTNPVLSAPTPAGTIGTQTTATIGATSDQSSGTLYAVVDTGANLAGVTAAEIKAGQRAGGAAALKSGNSAVSTTTPSVGVTALTAATAYVYAAIQNNANGDSNTVTGSFTTAAVSPQSSPPPGAGARVAILLLT